MAVANDLPSDSNRDALNWSEKPELHEILRRQASVWFAVITVIGAAVVFIIAVYITTQHFTHWEEVLRDHFAAIIGLPGAAAAAFTIVVLLRQTEGPIEFEGLGFKFKGAAGQVVLWIASFLAIAAAIKWTW
ncbi:hypothetical protein HFN01_24445 [Rhizobium leguminosarum]|uniref:hypothetical protein n=1 Tax=Rhizobium leguminosarum TaxID=384 RepID=UPI001C9486AB|nr:hypothetical protein [Rhizobium leguminosarum]MBY5397967.1 hypothetical protein [Rhizobium leguminosarum]